MLARTLGASVFVATALAVRAGAGSAPAVHRVGAAPT
jgi:hypothetical protein